AAAELGYPLGGPLVVILIFPPGDLDEIDRRHALAQQGSGRFMLEVFVELPGAIGALEIRGREADYQEQRVANAVKNAIDPHVQAQDVASIEEDAEVLATGADELAMIGFDAVLELGDAALGIVAPGVADEKVVGHGRCFDGSDTAIR